MSCIEPVLILYVRRMHSVRELTDFPESFVHKVWHSMLQHIGDNSECKNAKQVKMETAHVVLRRWEHREWRHVIHEFTESDTSTDAAAVVMLQLHPPLLSRVKPWMTTREGRWLPSITSPPYWENNWFEYCIISNYCGTLFSRTRKVIGLLKNTYILTNIYYVHY